MTEERSAGDMPLTVKTNFAWNFIGKLTYAASRAAALMIIAKLGTPGMVGQYALAFAVTAPVFMLADLDLRSILATDSNNAAGFGDYLGLRLVTALMGMAVVFVIALLQGGAQTGLIIILVGSSKGIESVSDMLFGLLQKNQRLDKLGISLMLKGVLSIPAMVLPLLYLHSLPLGVALVAAALLAVLLLYDIPVVRPYAELKIRLVPKDLWILLRLSIPLGIVLLFNSLIKNLPNYFIRAFYGEESLGYFSSMIYFLSAGSLVASALSQSVNARLARHFSLGDTEGFAKLFAKVLLFTLSIGVCMFLVAAAAGREILILLYRPEYARWQSVFLLVMGTAGISYSAEITMSALTAAHKFKVQPVAGGCVILAGIVFNCLLVPRFGLVGAAVSVLLSSCLQLAISLWLLARAMVGRKKDADRKTAAAGRELTVEALPPIGSLSAGTLSAWKELFDRGGSQAAFSDPGLLAVWWRVFGKGRESMLLAVREKGELVAIFPLAARKRFLKQVTFLGFPQASHTDFPCREGYLDEAAAAVAQHLRKGRGIAVYHLAGLREDGGLYKALTGQLAARHIPQFSGSAPSPVIHTGGLKYEEFYKNRFSSHAVKNNARDEKRLAALGPVSVRELTLADMAEAFALHDLRWRKKMDTSGFTSGESREFFTALLDSGGGSRRALALGLYLGERLVAFQYGFLFGKRALLYKSAHDDLLGIYAPGKMIKREFIRRCLELGADTVDLGVGYEEYKEEWTGESDTIRSVSFPQGNLPSYLCFFCHFLRERLRGRIKQSRKIVLFKRNTLGLVRYRLSFGGWKKAFRRGRELLRRHGAFELLPKIRGGKPVELFCRDLPRPLPAAECGARTATLRDAEEIALLMNCAPTDVVRRFYRQQRCYLADRDGSVSCLAWVSVEKSGTVISDLCRDKRFCRGEDIASLLGSILAGLPEKDYREARILIPRHHASAVRAVLQKKFSSETAEKETAGRRKGRVGNAGLNHT